MNKKGQSVFTEYVMIIFAVIAVVVAMSTFVQRGFEGRIHDARNYLINAVSNVCDANCQEATGSKTIPTEYEPYYELYNAIVENDQNEMTGATSGNSQILGAIYIKKESGASSTSSTSDQLPPACAGPNPPICCSDGSGCLTCSCPVGHVCGPDTCGNSTGCGSCGTGFGCNNSTGQCYRCTCQAYTPGGMCPAYTANCGADNCGNPNACGSCSSYGTTSYCSIGRCWVPLAAGGANCANCAHPCF